MRTRYKTDWSAGCIADIFSNGPHPRSMANFPSSTCVRDCGTDTAQPSSLYRDMGTQMTPNPSVRLSRRANPGTCTESPGRHNTPDHSRRTACLGAPATADTLDVPTFHVEKLGRSHEGAHTHPLLDRNLNWSTREEEEEESATCLRTQSEGGETQPSPYVAWAAAWEEAERAKYTARYLVSVTSASSSHHPPITLANLCSKRGVLEPCPFTQYSCRALLTNLNLDFTGT